MMEQRRAPTEKVQVNRLEMPESYGIPSGKEGMPPWGHVRELIAVTRSRSASGTSSLRHAFTAANAPAEMIRSRAGGTSPTIR